MQLTAHTIWLILILSLCVSLALSLCHCIPASPCHRVTVSFRGLPHCTHPMAAPRSGDVDTVSYVFNGDFVDRGAHQVEVVLLLFSLKVLPFFTFFFVFFFVFFFSFCLFFYLFFFLFIWQHIYPICSSFPFSNIPLTLSQIASYTTPLSSHNKAILIFIFAASPADCLVLPADFIPIARVFAPRKSRVPMPKRRDEQAKL